ncbi:hypothetical protein DC522_05075 [Microvirga sp. KLBC 81]|nr:hypothetical protein DC522_05075 [Microvirga sp. KLBC 81]
MPRPPSFSPPRPPPLPPPLPPPFPPPLPPPFPPPLPSRARAFVKPASKDERSMERGWRPRATPTTTTDAKVERRETIFIRFLREGLCRQGEEIRAVEVYGDCK